MQENRTLVFTSAKKMEYVGIATQQWRNNMKSGMLLLAFPLLVCALVYIGCYCFGAAGGARGDNYNVASALIKVNSDEVDAGAQGNDYNAVSAANKLFWDTFPFVFLAISAWFIIAFFANVYIIDRATGARTLERRDNKRVYNLVENLCISCGMEMPKVHVIEDPALNAFASGVSSESYTVTLTRGIIDKLDDKELEGVIAHELMHIRNKDVRVLIISIVFVGIFAMIAELSLRMAFSSTNRRNRGKGNAPLFLIAMLLAAIGYGVSMLMRFAISRKREYMADAGAAELTKEPLALAGALRKISGNSVLRKEQGDSVAQLFIEHKPSQEGFKSAFVSVFATHPPIERRIAVLEQF